MLLTYQYVLVIISQTFKGIISWDKESPLSRLWQKIIQICSFHQTEENAVYNKQTNHKYSFFQM